MIDSQQGEPVKGMGSSGNEEAERGEKPLLSRSRDGNENPNGATVTNKNNDGKAGE